MLLVKIQKIVVVELVVMMRKVTKIKAMKEPRRRNAKPRPRSRKLLLKNPKLMMIKLAIDYDSIYILHPISYLLCLISRGRAAEEKNWHRRHRLLRRD